MALKRMMTARAGRGDRAGLTLVEVVVTSGVLAVALAGLMQLYVCCLWQSEGSGNLTAAMSEAYGMWEEIRAANFDTVVTNYSQGGTPGNTFTLNGLNGRGVIYLDTSVAGMIQVDVVVSWRERATVVIGEDQNLNGQLDAGEDTNQNGRLDSPAMIASLLARR